MAVRQRIEAVEKKINVDPKIERWEAVILDERDGKYYTNDLTDQRRQLNNDEMAGLRKPGIGLIVMKLVNEPLPKENLTTEEKND